MTLRTVLLSLQALLAAAEPDDPQDAVVANQVCEHVCLCFHFCTMKSFCLLLSHCGSLLLINIGTLSFQRSKLVYY